MITPHLADAFQAAIGFLAMMIGLGAALIMFKAKEPDIGLDATKIFMLCLLVLAVLTGCQSTLSESDQRFIEQRFEVMAALSGGTLPEPEIRWTYDPEFKPAAWTECTDFSVTLNARVNMPEFMAYTIVPHEYAHLLSCHYRGGIGADPHDEWWRQAVIQLKGDPDYV